MTSTRLASSLVALALGLLGCGSTGTDDPGTGGAAGASDAAGKGGAAGSGAGKAGSAGSAAGGGAGGGASGSAGQGGAAGQGQAGQAGVAGQGEAGQAGAAGGSEPGGAGGEGGGAGQGGGGAGQGGEGGAGMSGSSGQPGAGEAGTSGGSGQGGAGQGGAGGGAGGGGASGAGGSPDDGCSDGASDFVYVLTADNQLYTFRPPTLEFSLVGTLGCASFASPFSMAVARNGTAYSVFTDGTLHAIDTATAACQPTPFKANQQGFSTFGMGFSSQGSTGETLFVANSSGKNLGTIDLTTFALTPVGSYDKVTARAELTGTGDGRLFGAFEGSPYVVSEIDQATAAIKSQAPQTAINYPPNSSNFAFAFWGGDFWLFVGPGTKTDVFHYDPVAGTTEKVKTVPQVIVGAGVSTCAPVVKP